MESTHKVLLLHTEMWKSLSRIQLWPHGPYSPWNSPGQNTGVGSLSLPQGIFPTQGSNIGLLHCRWILHQLSHKGSPRILEWVAYPFSRGSSQHRNRTRVSCIASGFFTNWAMREALLRYDGCPKENHISSCWHCLWISLFNRTPFLLGTMIHQINCGSSDLGMWQIFSKN